MVSIDPEKLFRKSKVQVNGDIDDGIMYYHSGKRKFYTGNQMTKRIWDLLETPQSINQITATLQNDFDATADQIRTDVSSFFKQMEQEGLIESD